MNRMITITDEEFDKAKKEVVDACLLEFDRAGELSDIPPNLRSFSRTLERMKLEANLLHLKALLFLKADVGKDAENVMNNRGRAE